jgi:hypothetical protein
LDRVTFYASDSVPLNAFLDCIAFLEFKSLTRLVHEDFRKNEFFNANKRSPEAHFEDCLYSSMLLEKEIHFQSNMGTCLSCIFYNILSETGRRRSSKFLGTVRWKDYIDFRYSPPSVASLTT